MDSKLHHTQKSLTDRRKTSGCESEAAPQAIVGKGDVCCHREDEDIIVSSLMIDDIRSCVYARFHVPRKGPSRRDAGIVPDKAFPERSMRSVIEKS